MGQRMTWEEMKKAYPDEWVAVVKYISDECGDVDGEVVAHSKNKDDFYQELNALVPHTNLRARYAENAVH